MELPESFFIFVSQLHPMAYMNYANSGSFTSRFAQFLLSEDGLRQLDSGELDPMPFAPNPNVYPLLSPFSVSAMTECRVEWDAETARRRHEHMAPSRMSAVYAFGDEDTCREVAARYGWPLDTVRRFQLANEWPYRVIRVNMEIVSLLRTVYPLASWQEEHLDDIWRRYWKGDGNVDVETPDLHEGQNWRRWSSGVTWEWLIEGKLESDGEAVF
jgi:hypothetical protein